jgi:hypothetical protein
LGAAFIVVTVAPPKKSKTKNQTKNFSNQIEENNKLLIVGNELAHRFR